MNSKPDILIPYDRSKAEDSSIIVIAVRPETNKIDYESVIVSAIEPYAELIYLANLSGDVVKKHSIILAHSSSQFTFSVVGKEEIAKYPEMIKRFEEKFGESFDKAKIVGSYETICDNLVDKDAESLFSTIVPDDKFLEFYGQTIKKIDDYYIINYDIPAIFGKYGSSSDIFVIAIRLKDSTHSFSSINKSIYQSFYDKKEIDLLDQDLRKNMKWFDQVRRTYHISKNHIDAMFDLTNYVFVSNNARIDFPDTPLGIKLISLGIFSKNELISFAKKLNDNPLVKIRDNDNNAKLANVMNLVKMSNTPVNKESLTRCANILAKVEIN